MSEKLKCRECSNDFEWTRPDAYAWKPYYCPPCTAKEIEKNYQAARSKVETEIMKITPGRFQATDTGHPDFNRRLWERIRTWCPTDERPWLGLIGPTGTCKTRSAFMLMREIALAMIRPASSPDHMTSKPTIAVVSAYRFAETVMAQFSNETKGEANEALRRFHKVNVLLIDDLGKQRNTPAVSTELFALLDHRHADNLCTIWTANSAPEVIVQGVSEDMAAPLAGRIRECSTIINLG